MKKPTVKRGTPFKVIPKVLEIDGVKRPGWWRPVERHQWDLMEQTLMDNLYIQVLPKPIGLKKERRK